MTRVSFFQTIAALFTGGVLKAQAEPKAVDAAPEPVKSTQPIKIFSSGWVTGSTIEVDGVKIPHVRTIRYEHVAGELPIVTLEIQGRFGVEIDGHSVVHASRFCPSCDARQEIVLQSRKKVADAISRVV